MDLFHFYSSTPALQFVRCILIDHFSLLYVHHMSPRSRPYTVHSIPLCEMANAQIKCTESVCVCVVSFI